MRPTFAAQLNKMITAGLGGAVAAPETGVAVGRRTEWTEIGPAPLLTFESNAELPFRALSVDLEPIQDLHGQEAPYPPGGGKNKLPTINATQTINGVTWTLNPDGSIKLTGTATANSVYDFGRDIVTLPPGSYTTFDVSVSEAYAVAVFKVVSGTATVIKNGGGAFTLTEDTSVFVRYTVASGTVVNNTIYPQLESGSAATTYVPYSNICPISGREAVNVWREETYDSSATPAIAIQLGQTVYGGTVDVVTGEMVVDRAMVDLGTLTWTANGQSGDNYEYATTISGKANGKTNMICSALKVSEISALYAICGRANSALVSSVSLETTAAAFKTAMSGVQLCYELEQPITITLTPEQLSSLIGANNVWSDADSVSLTYGNIYYTEGY